MLGIYKDKYNANNVYKNKEISFEKFNINY